MIFRSKQDVYLRAADFALNPDDTSNLIVELIKSGKPFMVARIGAFELATINNFLGISSKDSSAWKYITGRQGEFWWEESILKHMESNAGFFPASYANAELFSKLMLHDIEDLDVLAEWKSSYHIIKEHLPFSCVISHLVCVEPFFANNPWTKALKGKKVLVVHPFAELINTQYDKREHLFSNPDMLPDFQLKTLKAVQSIGGESNGFEDWFKALEWMKLEIDKIDYDVCLLGCGAYGFPLAAHCKRMGKQSIHLGGSLQLLFGIIGKRWEHPDYGVFGWGIPQGAYTNLINEYWVRPGQNELPRNASQVEGACYW